MRANYIKTLLIILLAIIISTLNTDAYAGSCNDLARIQSDIVRYQRSISDNKAKIIELETNVINNLI